MHLSPELLTRFRDLLEEARASGDPEPTAMSLATAGADGSPSLRTVLLKGVDAGGFVFYTNTESHKGAQLAVNPRVALLFLWKPLRQQVQVKIEGIAHPVSAAEADAYFASRPRMSQIGAWASDQSRTLGDRSELIERITRLEAQYAGKPVPRPPHWSGYRVEPSMIEFWFGETYRLHHRERFEVEDGHWRMRLLYP
jgi:pyridoxamine 5'-phosphate oxidase